MRRIVLLVIALVVTFGAFAKNPLPASAPTHAAGFSAAEAVAEKRTRPAEKPFRFTSVVGTAPMVAPLPEILEVAGIEPGATEDLVEAAEPSLAEFAAETEYRFTESAGWLYSFDPNVPMFRLVGLEKLDVIAYENAGLPKVPAELIRADLTADPDSVETMQAANFCDQSYIGAPIRFSQTAELTLDDLLYQIHTRFGVNFLMGPNVGNLPINIKAGSVPWNTLLRSQLFVLGIRARCINDNTVELVANQAIPSLQDTAEVTTRFIKLNYLQPTIGGNVNVAGQASGRGAGQQGGCEGGGGSGGGGGGIGGGGIGGGGGQQACGNFEKLIIEIEKILGIRSMTQSSIGGGGGQAGGQTQQTEEIRRGRSVSVIPGRNILVIRAADDEMDLINEIITRADRPPFQVIIKGLIYTANENKLRDIGIQPTITATTADGRTSGGIRGHTIGGDGTLFDFATIIGTVDFLVQASALQEDGVISIKSRPFATVLDGDTTDLTVGRQVPVLIQAQNAIGGVPGTLQILQAANLLSVTPQVIDDEMGNPMAVNLTLQLESNDVDLSVVSQGVPSVSVRSIQSRFILNQEQTVILGGFTVDSDNRTVSKTPGLGDIPIIGELFKRRVRSSQINRLYFALSVTVVPFPEVTRPVIVPGATTEVPSLTPEMLKRAEQAEPKQVAPQPTRTGP
jgi:hypothetical protein